MEIKLGSKIYFSGEKRPYTVKAMDDRYIICTKPFNLKKTCFYTIIDLKQDVRGTNNLVFNMYDYMIQEDINECLEDLQKGEIEVSYRNRVFINITRVDAPKAA